MIRAVGVSSNHLIIEILSERCKRQQKLMDKPQSAPKYRRNELLVDSARRNNCTMVIVRVDYSVEDVVAEGYDSEDGDIATKRQNLKWWVEIHTHYAMSTSEELRVSYCEPQTPNHHGSRVETMDIMESPPTQTRMKMEGC